MRRSPYRRPGEDFADQSASTFTYTTPPQPPEIAKYMTDANVPEGPEAITPVIATAHQQLIFDVFSDCNLKSTWMYS